MATDFQSLYILASGLYYQQRKLETVSNNLANVNTPGFKKDLLSAMAFEAEIPPDGKEVPPPLPGTKNQFIYPVVGKRKIDTSGGPLLKTDNPLDVAIQGEGFFAVEVKGKVLYTRNGHFLLDRRGYLVDQKGNRILGENGPIYLGRVSLSSIRITEDGTIFVGNRSVGKLKIVNLKGLRKVGDSLFEGKPAEAKNYKVVQGHLEGSNVNPVK